MSHLTIKQRTNLRSMKSSLIYWRMERDITSKRKGFSKRNRLAKQWIRSLTERIKRMERR